MDFAKSLPWQANSFKSTLSRHDILLASSSLATDLASTSVAWIREHFPMFRHARDPAYIEDLPLAARWLLHRETTMETTYHYHGMLDDLHLTSYTRCIRDMAVLEPYLPDRVLRQFGVVQLVPGPPLVPLRDSRGVNETKFTNPILSNSKSCHPSSLNAVVRTEYN
ncbi:hypothetical protein RHMOL_Rhmol08G0158800 [Rhododendron molle]|uniref:Uncharacterized protein n=1 Tax=Rhododendron molle TaxID=49168 RepID=A0ACC0MP38_RHOML|nr:hypothetical protein RHMOL_Rhmol08G0158800 [Rhododendron molle]